MNTINRGPDQSSKHNTQDNIIHRTKNDTPGLAHDSQYESDSNDADNTDTAFDGNITI